MNSALFLILAFVAGLALGAALRWTFLPGRHQQKQLQKERDEALAALAQYRAEIDNHFLKTAELVNQMTSSYRAVHEQLSSGARQLCSETGRRLAASKALDDSFPGNSNKTLAEQPLDYAPSAQGTLAEDFGLKHTKRPDPFEPVTHLTDTDVTAEEASPQAPRDYADGCEDQGCSIAGETSEHKSSEGSVRTH